MSDTKNNRRLPISTRMPDTVPIVRIAIVSGKTDTLLQFPNGVLQGEIKRDASGTVIESTMGLGPYGARNGWIATADGHIVVANGASYELNVLDRSGAPVSRWKLATNAPAVSKKGWAAYVDKATNGAAIAVQNMQNETFAKMGVAPPTQPTTRYVVPEMPATLPALQFGDGWRRMHVVGDIAWIPVNRVDPPTSSHWDLVNLTTGKRINTIVLPDKQYVRGVTRLGAYVYAIDDDDLQRILLYRFHWPTNSSTTAKPHQ